VGASKIAYLGWGADIAALGFKAISGHATGVTAVYPLAAYLLCRTARPGLGLAAGGAGLMLGALVALELVLHGEHTVAEAAIGWLLGAGASIATLYRIERSAGVTKSASPAGARSSHGRLPNVGVAQFTGGIGSPEGADKLVIAASRERARNSGGLEGVELAGKTGETVITGYILSACCAVLVFAASATLMQSAHVGYWMIKIALALSGNARPFSWDSGG
jgi:hypothetical protein